MTKISVTPAQMEAAQESINKISKDIDTKLDTLRSMLQQLDWEGTDRTAYQAHQAEWDRAVTDINNILNQIGGAVGIAKANYVTTEMNNARAWGG
jgi:6 kDa early secretory antigenic target